MRAFSLIETIIYLALFGILMGGAVVSAANLFESQSRSHTTSVIEDEGNFLIGKINWALYGAEAVTSPPLGSSGTTLTITKWDTAVGNPLVINQNGTNLTLSRAGGTAVVLNNSNVAISNLSFQHIAGSGDGVQPEGLKTSFTLTALTPNGMVVSRSFTSTNYVRK